MGSDMCAYDANGNMTRRVDGGVTYTQTFDVDNRLTTVLSGTLTTQFAHDAERVASGGGAQGVGVVRAATGRVPGAS